MSIRDLYEKVNHGVKLTNAEVQQGAAFYTDLAASLFKAGPAFVIAAKEASRTAQTLQMYANARGLPVKGEQNG